MKELSIIIPTYKNTKFIKECLDSISKSIKNRDVEILIGIDACLNTLDFVKSNSFDKRFNFYFFEKNSGPYIVKNTLIELTSSEDILFFDSDDIMCENMIDLTIQELKNNLVVKPSYVEFIDGKEIDLNSKLIRSEGVFAINKQVLLDFNGFEPWVCAADTDLSLRLAYKGVRFKFIDEILFYRRVHEGGLTSRKDTGGGSDLRKKYNDIILTKKNRGPLEKLHTTSFSNIDEVDKTKVQEVNDLFVEKEKKKEVLSKILNVI